MLKVEKQVCKYPSCNKGCEWIPLEKVYADNVYDSLRRQVRSQTSKSHIAYRIIHTALGVLTTFKMGHDKELFIQSDRQNLTKLRDSLRAIEFGRDREKRMRRTLKVSGKLGERIHRVKS